MNIPDQLRLLSDRAVETSTELAEDSDYFFSLRLYVQIYRSVNDILRSGLECICLAFANPDFATELFVVDYSLDDVFLLVGLFETGVVCGRFASANYARSDGYGESTE